jgi:hypothetical protein
MVKEMSSSFVRAALAAALLTGCQSPAILSTARTLPRGAADVSVSLNLTRVSIRPSEVEGTRVPSAAFTYPSVLPELIISYGVLDDFELRGRLALASGLIEGGVKYRFIHADTFHVALAPAFGYRTLGIVNGPVATLPLIFTYDLDRSVSLSGGPLISAASYDVPDDLDGGDDADLGGDTLYAGGALGVELRAGRFHVMPSVELQRSVSRSGDVADLPAINLIFISLTAGLGGH